MDEELPVAEPDTVEDSDISCDSQPTAPQQPTTSNAKTLRRTPWSWTRSIFLFAFVIFVTYQVMSYGINLQADLASSKELSAESIFKEASPAVVRVDVRDRDSKLISQGSGFLISEDGLVATNCHVIEGADFAQVVFPDDSKSTVEGVASYMTSADLAVLKIAGSQFPVLALADDELPDIGSKVYAIGNPRGLTNTLSDGLVSGLRLVSDDFSLIQTSAPISSGSSGGPLLSRLRPAAIPVEVDGPEGIETRDFHALRACYISNVIRAGADLKQAMTLARHSDPKLTVKR
jgi:S1-C subfamily serine protease